MLLDFDSKAVGDPESVERAAWDGITIATLM